MHYPGTWYPIDTAPQDGSLVFLLSEAYDAEMIKGETTHFPPRVALGKWDPEGTSWVDENGRIGGPGEAYTLAVTGTWDSRGGWFQPDEVTHWSPLPGMALALAPRAGVK